MKLEAVWLKKGREVYKVDPVLNIVCDDDMKDMSDIEVYNGYNWCSISDVSDNADDFVIRLVKKGGKER